jgi:3-phenylpropionate/cinnamic acid dioxygenase small subunit
MPTDEDAIRNLIALHAQLTDDGEFKERVNLYTEDGVFDFAGVTSVGRDQLASAFAASSEPARRGKHITSNTVIEIDGTRADVRTDWAFLRPGADGFTVFASGRYFDLLEKHEGQWLFKQRRIVPIAQPSQA